MAVYIDGNRRDRQLNNVPTRGTEEHHLGLDQVGYDADDQRYTYRDPQSGNTYTGDEGNHYGDVRPNDPFLQSTMPPATPRWSEYPPLRPDGAPRDQYPAWRYFAPFAVIVLTVLLLLFRYVNSSSVGDGLTWPEKPIECADAFKAYTISKGDTCWSIAEGHEKSVDDLIGANRGLDCDKLVVGKQICVWK